MQKYRLMLLFVLPLGLAFQAAAQDEYLPPKSYSELIWDYLSVGSSLTVGLGTREADLTVKRLSDNASGKLVQRNERSYFLSYSTRPIFFKDSKFGYDIMFNLSTFHMHQQETANNVYQDLGTSAHGGFAYVVPTLFYLWGDHQKGTYIKAGIGLGAGMAKYEGDIILTDSATKDRINISHQSTELNVASSVVLEGRWKNWGLLLTFAGPDVNRDGVETQIGDIALCLGYRFTF
jgi:hypothetical protein